MHVSAVSSSLAGIQAAQAMLDASARKVADGDGDSDGDMVDGIVGAQVARTSLEANVAVLRTALDSEHSLIDVFA